MDNIFGYKRDCCMNCTHFKIWDEDPCCLEKDDWKIVLPTMYCKKHEKETFKPVLEMHNEMWDACKKEFFERYTIDKQELIDEYLGMFPDDKELINVNKDKIERE